MTHTWVGLSIVRRSNTAPWQRCLWGIMGLFLCHCLTGAPIMTLPGTKAKRIGASEGDTTAVYIIRSGKEVLQWDAAEIPAGVYRVEMTVRTGNTGSNPLNIVHMYRLWTVAEDGTESTPVEFVAKPGSTPVKTSEKWPHFVGDIVSTTPLVVDTPRGVRATAAAHWSEIREVRFVQAPMSDMISSTLDTSAEWHLTRRGQVTPVVWQVQSFLDREMTVAGQLRVETPDGNVSQLAGPRILLKAGGTGEVTLGFTPTMNGLHILSLVSEWKGHQSTAGLAVGVVSVPVASELSDDSPFGVHPGGLKELYQSGFKWVRLWDSGDTWNSHEREKKGQFDFQHTDEKVHRFLEQGFKVLAVLAYTPTWASQHPEIGHYTGAGAPFPPANLEDWRDYCRKIMTYFRGRISHFEVWNEPNTGSKANLERGFFRGTTSDYVDLLRVAYEVSREVGPEIRIVGCSGTGDFLKWTEAVLVAGGGPYMDILSFHAYTTPSSPEDANLSGRIDRLHQIMAKYGVPDLPLWNTEVGYWTDRRVGVRPATAEELNAKAPAGLSPNWQASWPYRPITEADAAAFTVRHYLLNVANGVEKLFWYSSISSGQPLLCRDGGLRLACFAVANTSEQLNGAEYWRRIDLGLRKLHFHLWRKKGTVIAEVWHAGEETKELLIQGGSVLKILDIWGNPIDIQPNAEGVISLSAGRDPITLIGSEGAFTEVTLLTRELKIPVDDCFVVHEVNPTRPVKNHTSPSYHGERRVYGLPDIGDALGWRLAAIRPGNYSIFIELRSGNAKAPYGDLDWYDVSLVRGDERVPMELLPVAEKALAARVPDVPHAGGRAYGFATASADHWLEPGDEIHVTLEKGFGFVGMLMLREGAGQVRTHALPVLDRQPVLNGQLDEVAEYKPFRVDRRQQVVIGVADRFASTAENDAWKGPEDLSASFWAALTGKNLYIAVDIVDSGDRFPASRGPYNGDCIELFLDLRPDGDVGSSVMGDRVYQAMIRAPRQNSHSEVVGRPAPGTRACVVPTPNGWCAEILVPLAHVETGRSLGIDIAVDDDDNGKGRKAQMVWHGSSQNFQDPSAYGRFKIADR